jgi:hypothetical protein
VCVLVRLCSLLMVNQSSKPMATMKLITEIIKSNKGEYDES